MGRKGRGRSDRNEKNVRERKNATVPGGERKKEEDRTGRIKRRTRKMRKKVLDGLIKRGNG